MIREKGDQRRNTGKVVQDQIQREERINNPVKKKKINKNLNTKSQTVKM